MASRIFSLLVCIAMFINSSYATSCTNQPADCQEKCNKWPAMCTYVDYCIESCCVANVQRGNCKKWENGKPGN
eukprot:CAMPEP_0206585206 /NCGR_PEP_ID=MMETSP0325_2-20121206/36277_1 /ASSEMBLY_ACC=CAM_ASM_000347 /TAXON_ID=2866 /ORGANISM="Crypthecodinium cohnii, Strain Seligo" /LENGTH=72 /DNA_ID=CAMNT_0054092705 /DNA_START=101 /DNA_END=319 /DNA_ORIENTATION=-